MRKKPTKNEIEAEVLYLEEQQMEVMKQKKKKGCRDVMYWFFVEEHHLFSQESYLLHGILLHLGSPCSLLVESKAAGSSQYFSSLESIQKEGARESRLLLPLLLLLQGSFRPLNRLRK